MGKLDNKCVEPQSVQVDEVLVRPSVGMSLGG